jgi:hypothetical protein
MGEGIYSASMVLGRIISVAAIAGFLSFCGQSEKNGTAKQSTGPSLVVHLSADAVRDAGIKTALVGESTLDSVLTLTGTLAAKPWTAEEQAAVNDAESADAKRTLAEANFQRLSRLYSDGITARQDLDAARAEKDQAEAAAAQADARRANLGLSSSSRALERKAGIWGLASLSDVDLAQVKPGARVAVTTSAFPASVFSGQVIEVSRSEDPDTRTFTVRIAIEDPSGRLHPQMLANFAVSTPGTVAITIPRSAVLLEGEGSCVYIADGNAFQKQCVVTGAGTPDRIQVTAGLSIGQRIVIAGAQVLESERLKAQLKQPDED